MHDRPAMTKDTSIPKHRVRELRLRANLSLAKLAELVSSSAPRIYDLETGKTKLTQEWMQRLAPPLGCAPADILAEHDHAIVLSDAERTLVELVRTLPPERRDLVPALIGSLEAKSSV